MKRRGNSQETFANEKKEKPRYCNPGYALGGPENSDERGPAGQRRTHQLLQTRRTDHAIIVFRHAFPAIKTGALRAARHSLALSVVKASLVKEVLHDGTKFRKSLAEICR